MLDSLLARGCVRMCALTRGHTHGSVAFSVYPCLPLGPPRGAPCLVLCDCGYTRYVCTHEHQDTKTPPDSDDDTVAIVVDRLPSVSMVNPSLTQRKKGAAKEREIGLVSRGVAWVPGGGGGGTETETSTIFFFFCLS